MKVIPYESLFELVQSTLKAWRSNQSPDVQRFVEEHPSVRAEKSLLLDLVYEEYCQDREAARPPRVDRYLRDFPEYQESITRLIEVHSVLNEIPGSYKEPLQWPAVGEIHCGHEILAVLGRGAFSRVYLARQLELGSRLVVIKFSADFSDEANLLGTMGHPAIMPVYSVEQLLDLRLTMIVMPFQGSSTLLDVLDRCRNLMQPPQYAKEIIPHVSRPQASQLASYFPTEQEEPSISLFGTYVDWVLSVGRTLAEALEYVHARGIYHRDIKPSNILLSWSGVPILMDFNLAYSRNAMMQLDGGTLAYMSPERLRRHGRDHADNAGQGEADDIFGLGVVLYELLLGQHSAPIQPEWDIERQIKHYLASDRFHHLPEEIDTGTTRIIARCLDSNPSARGTATQLKNDLSRSLSGFARYRRIAKLHPRRVFISSLGMLTSLVGGGIFISLQPPEHIRLYEHGLTRYQNAEYQAASDLFSQALEIKGNHEVDNYFARGQANLWNKKFVSAGEDFESALRGLSDLTPAIIRECRAYCHLRLGNMRLASEIYESLMLEESVPMRIHNNLAFCRSQSGSNQGGLATLTFDIPQIPENAVLFHNRARIQFGLAISQKQPVPLSAWNDIQSAIQLGRNNALVHLEAAAIVLSVPFTGSADGIAIEHLQKAVEIGYPAKSLNNDLRYLRLKKLSAFQALLESPNSQNTVQRDLDLSMPPPASARLSDHQRK